MTLFRAIKNTSLNVSIEISTRIVRIMERKQINMVGGALGLINIVQAKRPGLLKDIIGSIKKKLRCQIETLHSRSGKCLFNT